jgi:hypothetical protein
MTDRTHTDRLAAALADRYRLERKLGEGGMASVYAAQDLRHRRQVAIKIWLTVGRGPDTSLGWWCASSKPGLLERRR